MKETPGKSALELLGPHNASGYWSASYANPDEDSSPPRFLSIYERVMSNLPINTTSNFDGSVCRNLK